MDDDLFGVHSKLTKKNVEYANLKRHDFYFCVYGRDGGKLAFSSDREGKKIDFPNNKSFMATELYLLLQQIGCVIDSKSEKINKEESIHNLEQSIERFTEILSILDVIKQNEVLKDIEKRIAAQEKREENC